MKSSTKIIFISLLFICLSAISFAQNAIQVSLVNPIQIVPETESITGIRLNLIYGKNFNVTGFDIGLANQTTGRQEGVQFGIVNLTDGGFTGWQDGFVNVTKGSSVGLQSGGVNYHQGHFKGLQISVFNYAATLKGLQIGLINVIGEGGFLPIFPIFNFDFD